MINIRAREIKNGLIFLIALIILAAMLIPYVWLALTALKNRVDIFSIPPKIFFYPTWSNFIVAFNEKGFLQNLRNSTIVALSSTIITLLGGVPAAYSLTRFHTRGNNLYLFFLLAARLLPGIVLAVPLFILFSKAKLINNFAAVVLSHITFNLPFAVWMMRSFFLEVPIALDEAATMDGCTPFGTFTKIVLPLVKGGLVATGIFCLINSWNEFLLALILTGRQTATMPVAIPGLMTPLGTFWGQIAAVGTVTTLPVMIFALIVQKYIVQGMTGGAIQGE
ncbi:MAG: carbohydrate ABC transporter permease [Chloroflexi bacterium]|nr:carbohydrate ABC transporter permease [Chloroflexota bacterium]